MALSPFLVIHYHVPYLTREVVNLALVVLGIEPVLSNTWKYHCIPRLQKEVAMEDHLLWLYHP